MKIITSERPTCPLNELLPGEVFQPENESDIYMVCKAVQGFPALFQAVNLITGQIVNIQSETRVYWHADATLTLN